MGTVQVAARPLPRSRFLHVNHKRPQLNTAALSRQCGRGVQSALSLKRLTEASPSADRNGVAGVVCGIVLQRGGGVLRRAVHAPGSAAIPWDHALIGIGIGGWPCCRKYCTAGSFRLMSAQCCMRCQMSLPFHATVQEASCYAGG